MSERCTRWKSKREKECVLLSGRLLSCDGLLVKEEGERETEREGGRRERAVVPQLHTNCWMQAATSLKRAIGFVCVREKQYVVVCGVWHHGCQQATFLVLSPHFLIYDNNVCVCVKKREVRIWQTLSFNHQAAVLNMILLSWLCAAKRITSSLLLAIGWLTNSQRKGV